MKAKQHSDQSKQTQNSADSPARASGSLAVTQMLQGQAAISHHRTSQRLRQAQILNIQRLLGNRSVRRNYPNRTPALFRQVPDAGVDVDVDRDSDWSQDVDLDAGSSDTPVDADARTSQSDASAATSQAQGLSPEAARQLHFAQTTLRRVEPLSESEHHLLVQAVPGSVVLTYIAERNSLREQVEQKTQQLEQMERETSAPPPEHGVPPSPEMIGDLAAELERVRQQMEQKQALIDAIVESTGATSESELVDVVQRQFPALFLKRAKAIALAQLDENQAIVEAELERYGIRDRICTLDTGELIWAIGQLRDKKREVEAVRNNLQIAESLRPNYDLPGGVPTEEQIAQFDSGYYDVQRIPQMLEELEEQEQQLETLRQQLGLQFPFLLQPGLDYEALASADEITLQNMVGGKLGEILDDIETTRDNIRSEELKVWDLNDIVEMTVQDMGIADNEVLQRMVRQRIREEESDEAILRIGLAALGIVAGLVATFATGGLALVAGGVALGIGGYQLSESVQNYLAEDAARNVALDPRIADISRNEPELFPIVLDLVGVVFDAADIVRAVNALRAPYRALAAGGELTDFARAARQALPADAAERVIMSAARREDVARTVENTIQAIHGTFRRADLEVIAARLEEMAQTGTQAVFENLRAQGRVLALNEEGLTAAFGAEKARQLIAEGALTSGNEGLFIVDAMAGTSHLFIRPGGLDSVTSTVVHESTHYLQRTQGAAFEGFQAEFEAFKMEQQYLRRLSQEAGLDAVPDNLMWLLPPGDTHIIRHIEEVYGFTRPTAFDAEVAVNEALRRLYLFEISHPGAR